MGPLNARSLNRHHQWPRISSFTTLSTRPAGAKTRSTSQVKNPLFERTKRNTHSSSMEKVFHWFFLKAFELKLNVAKSTQIAGPNFFICKGKQGFSRLNETFYFLLNNIFTLKLSLLRLILVHISCISKTANSYISYYEFKFFFQCFTDLLLKISPTFQWFYAGLKCVTLKNMIDLTFFVHSSIIHFFQFMQF